MSFNIKIYEALYPVCSKIYKYESRGLFAKIFSFLMSYKVKLDLLEVSINKLYDDSQLENLCKLFIIEFKRSIDNRGNFLQVLSKFETLLKTKLRNKIFGNDPNIQEQDIPQNEDAAGQVEEGKKEFQEKLDQKDNELKEEKKKSKGLQEKYGTLQKEKKHKSKDNLRSNVNSQDEIQNLNGNKDDDWDTITSYNLVESGKIRIND